MTIHTVLSKKDYPDCQVLIYIYNTWQLGQSFLKRTNVFTFKAPSPLPIENLFLKKRISRRSPTVLSKKDYPDCQVLIYIYNTWQSGQSFLKRTDVLTFRAPNPLPIENLFLKKRISRRSPTVLLKKDYPACQVLIYIYNTWQLGQSFLKRTVCMVMGH